MSERVIIDLLKGDRVLMSDINYVEALKGAMIITSKNKQAVFLYANDNYIKDMKFNMNLREEVNLEFGNREVKK